MIDYLASYVPPAVLRRIESDPTPAAAPAAEPADAVVLFADISGFTALAERLAQRGAFGVEELTRTLNMVFDLLIELVDTYGGEVTKFAGDALLALWPCPGGAGMEESATRAAQAALAMHARLVALQRLINQAPLTLRVGVGAGPVTVTTLGGVRDRWDVLVAGDAVSQAVLAQQNARPGEVALSGQAWGLAVGRCDGMVRAGGAVVVVNVHAPLPPVRPRRPQLEAGAAEAVRAFIPGAVLAQLREGEARWIGELRRISVLFIGLPELGADPERQQTVMCALQAALYRFEGSINKLSVDDKGVTLVAALGLPPLAHEDDAARALRAALAAGRAIEELGGRCVVGIASGRVFCGAIGNDLRREYTMIGDVVNVAARLLQAAAALDPSAPSAILCDDATATAARGQVDLESLPPITMKGKSQPVSVHRPAVRSSSPAGQAQRARAEVVGRAEERERLLAALAGVAAGGAARAALIEGEAGMGKSWLIADMLREAGARRVTVFTGGGDALERSTPYYAWRNIFSQLYDIDVLSDPEARRRHMLDLLELEPELLERAPLLNTVLPLDLPDTEHTRGLPDSARAEQTRQMLVACLRSSTARSPKVVVLDDMHWGDSASWALAEMIARDVPRLLLVVAARPAAGQPYADGIAALRALAAERLVLDSLSRPDMRRLVAVCLGVTAVPDPAIELIWDKAQGNPFFSAELAYALRDSGLLLIEGGTCLMAAEAGSLHAVSLPDTLQGVITSRIDRLTPAQQLTLKTASVIGYVFAERALQAIYPVVHERPQLTQLLSALEQQDMTMPEPLEPEVAYRFKHAITQEVVYDLMLFAQRRALHRSLALWYERIYADDLDRYFQLLAHHWGRAGDIARALDYLDRAAQHAVALCAYSEARSLFEQAIEMAGRVEPPQPARLVDLRYALGETLWFQGDLHGARVTLEDALALARAHASESPIARILSRLARVYDDAGDMERASAYLGESYTIATRIGDRQALVGILRNMGNEAMLRGRLATARRYWLESLGVAGEVGDRAGAARALGNLGWGAYLQREYAHARAWLRQSAEIAQEIGDKWILVDSQISLGLSLADDRAAGERLAEARATVEGALATALRLGVMAKALFALAALARCHELEGDAPQAVALATLAARHPLRGRDALMVAEPILERLAAATPPEAFAAAASRGESLTLEAARRELGLA